MISWLLTAIATLTLYILQTANHGKFLDQEGVQALLAMAGTQDLDLMQQMFYNGHYKAHGAKVQHLLQADGMV